MVSKNCEGSSVRGRLKMANVSDVHFGHPNTATVDIIKNMTKAFPDTAETGELDIIWFSGDLFDRLLYLSDPNVYEVRFWISSFLRMCKRRDITVRVLEGTPSHDWGQPRIFSEINEMAEIGADIKYVPNLSIECIAKFDINVLYVPDEWRPENDETWQEVVALLQTHGLDQVDYAIMHGSFPHQLPAHVNAPTHDPDRYLSIVKHFIFIGHVHKHSIFERILVPGSFDRLCHGEEGPKGHLRVTVYEDGQYEIVFVENKGAKIYRTINCIGMELDVALSTIDAIVKDLPDGSYLRIEADKEEAILVNLDVLRAKYPTCVWSTKVSAKTTTGKEMLVDMRSMYKGIALTKDNLGKLMLERLSAKVSDPFLLERCRELLNEVI